MVLWSEFLQLILFKGAAFAVGVTGIMFKKPAEAKSFQRLSGADRKKLRRSIKERFTHATDADIDELLPPKESPSTYDLKLECLSSQTNSMHNHFLIVLMRCNSHLITMTYQSIDGFLSLHTTRESRADMVEISVAKFPNRAHVYSIEGGFPILFDVDGRGSELFPTVFALWKVPELLPAFVLKGGEVSRFVISGADLMFPGISIPPDGLPPFLAGQPWSVKVPGNNAPIAVGSTMMSSAEAVKAGLRGKALHILHCYHDSLWESVEGQLVPNAGFLEDMVIEDPALVEVSTEQASSEEVHNDSVHLHDTNANETHEKVMDAEAATPEQSAGVSARIEVEGDTASQMTSNFGTLRVADEVSATVAEEHTDDKDQHVLSSEEIDILLDKCLLQALHATIKDKDLPMSGSALWSSHVLPCRPAGVTLDIKRSSHKKLSKWLQSKSSAGLISAKEDKHKKEVVLISVNRTHPDYTSFRPEKHKPASAVEGSEVTSSHQARTQLDIVEIYKSTTHVNPILAAVGADPGKYFSASEASEIVFSYIEKENLVKPTNKAIIVLDAALCDALYKGSVKKGSTYPTEIHKKDLGAAFLNRMQVHHRVTRGSDSTIRKGAVKPVQIMSERRQGNKKVTRVSGLESFLMDPESLASELQKKFACSTSVAELPGKKGQHEVLVQGGVIDDLARHLVEHYGINKRYIEVLDKTRK
ncbi:Eukaryotic translation initiation factor 2D [Nymphaea thermarum]|nr:Eukaryotic translation initiation factor 2D [Nymphaea thermarum]